MDKRIKFYCCGDSIFRLTDSNGRNCPGCIVERELGFAKALMAYGKSILREERKMNDGHNGEA